jgi:anti-anti-sigma factor
MAVPHVTTHADGPVTIVRLAGDLNLATAPDLAAQLGRLLLEGRRYLIIDLSQLGSCDAAGVHSLRGGMLRTQASGGLLYLVHPDGRFLDAVDPGLRLINHPSLAAARASLMAMIPERSSAERPLPADRASLTPSGDSATG